MRTAERLASASARSLSLPAARTGAARTPQAEQIEKIASDAARGDSALAPFFARFAGSRKSIDRVASHLRAGGKLPTYALVHASLTSAPTSAPSAALLATDGGLSFAPRRIARLDPEYCQAVAINIYVTTLAYNDARDIFAQTADDLASAADDYTSNPSPSNLADLENAAFNYSTAGLEVIMIRTDLNIMATQYAAGNCWQ
ncbi:MAG: hypothetical protein K2X99_01620 [Gemmatimonadaceae bacterium]|nr:hypothetical protein [Gemmatimonadaceae bacterium]